jgi:hypothetical protein
VDLESLAREKIVLALKGNLNDGLSFRVRAVLCMDNQVGWVCPGHTFH